MAWFSGTTTDYRDLLSKMVEYASNDNVQTVAVNAGGTGYTLGDVLTISGGTSTTSATCEVTAESSGVVTEVRMLHGGAYTVDPTLTGAATTGGTGSGCTVDITMQTAGWAILRQESQLFVIATQSIIADGSGYLVNDILTVDASSVGGTTQVTAATLRVTSVGGSGEVTGVSVETAGEYSAFDEGGTYAVTGGTGTGLTLNLLSEGDADQDQVILQGSGSGSDEIYIGVRTYSISISSVNNWEIAGMTGFTATQSWEGQPSISPGRYDGSSGDGGVFLPLRDVSMNYWMSVTSRRIILYVQAGSNFHNSYMGFIDPFATSTEYPYPLYISATSTEPDRTGTSSDVGQGGMPDPIKDGSGDDIGPGILRTPSGSWRSVHNGYQFGTGLDTENGNGIQMWPSACRPIISIPAEDQWANSPSNILRINDFLIPREVGDTPFVRIEPTPNTGGAIQPLFPLTLYDEDEQIIYGQLNNVFWVSTSQDGSSSATSNDTFTIGSGARYRVFQNVYRTEIYNHSCVQES